MVVNLSHKHSLVSNWMAELRNIALQGDSTRLRRNLQHIGGVAAYEISRELPWQTTEIQTPLGVHKSKVLQQRPVIAAVLPGGIALYNGLLSFFENAASLFIGATKTTHRDGQVEVNIDYLSNILIENRVIIISDMMIATGTTIIKTLAALRSLGTPAGIYIVCTLASTTGIEYIRREAGIKVRIICGDVDDEITARGFIVPGLSFGGDPLPGVESAD